MRITLIIFLLFVNIFALDKFSAVDKENRLLLERILNELNIENISSDTKMKIYKKISIALIVKNETNN